MDEKEKLAVFVVSSFLAGVWYGYIWKTRVDLDKKKVTREALSLGQLDKELAIWVTKAVSEGMDRNEIITKANEKIKYRNIVAGEIQL